MNTTFSKMGKIFAGIATLIGILGGLYALYPLYQNYKTPDMKGRWRFTFHIKSSSYKPYVGKSSGYKIYVSQESEKIKCDGEMCWIDDEEIPFSQHIPITMEGQIDGENMSLNYTQKGAKRTTVGELQLKLMPDKNLWKGTFSGTAANTSGTVEAEKILDLYITE